MTGVQTCALPILAERILDVFSNVGSVILDCYAGSGTFLDAAKHKRNTFIGIEKAYSTIKKKTKGMGEKNGRDTRALSNVWTDISPIVPWSKERNEHPTQKPLQIAERILDVFSNEGSVILDCYAGSGTFLEAAKHKRNTFIGIEKEVKYYDLAVARVFG